MTHPIHSADALPCNYIPDWDRNEPCETCTVCGDTRYGKSASKCEKYLAHLQKVGAAAQVGANGAAVVTMSISDDKGFPEVLSEFVCNMEAGQPFGKGSMALTRYIDVWAARRFLAAGAPAEPKASKQAALQELVDIAQELDMGYGAPAETPKPDEHDYRIAQHEQVDAAILSRLIVEGVVDRNRVVALRREIRPTIATPAATIGAGEGKDALDAAQWRFLAEHAHSGGISFLDYVIHSDDVENWGATMDAAMRSKMSQGEAG